MKRFSPRTPSKLPFAGLLVALGLLLPGGSVSAQTLVTGTPSSNTVYAFDDLQTSVGETFLALNSGLVDFTFYFGIPGTVTYTATVAEINDLALGKVLYTSAPVTTTAADFTPVPTTFSFATPLALDMGSSYVAFLSLVSGKSGVSVAAVSDYADGSRYLNGPRGGESIVEGSVGRDVVMEAHFAPLSVVATPEPTILILFATGLAGIWAVARRIA